MNTAMEVVMSAESTALDAKLLGKLQESRTALGNALAFVNDLAIKAGMGDAINGPPNSSSKHHPLRAVCQMPTLNARLLLFALDCWQGTASLLLQWLPALDWEHALEAAEGGEVEMGGGIRHMTLFLAEAMMTLRSPIGVLTFRRPSSP